MYFSVCCDSGEVASSIAPMPAAGMLALVHHVCDSLHTIHQLQLQPNRRNDDVTVIQQLGSAADQGSLMLGGTPDNSGGQMQQVLTKLDALTTAVGNLTKVVNGENNQMQSQVIFMQMAKILIMFVPGISDLARTVQSSITATSRSAPATAEVCGERRLKEIFGENYNFPADSLKQVSEMEKLLDDDLEKRDLYVSISVLCVPTPTKSFRSVKASLHSRSSYVWKKKIACKASARGLPTLLNINNAFA